MVTVPTTAGRVVDVPTTEEGWVGLAAPTTRSTSGVCRHYSDRRCSDKRYSVKSTTPPSTLLPIAATAADQHRRRGPPAHLPTRTTANAVHNQRHHAMSAHHRRGPPQLRPPVQLHNTTATGRPSAYRHHRRRPPPPPTRLPTTNIAADHHLHRGRPTTCPHRGHITHVCPASSWPRATTSAAAPCQPDNHRHL
jgi:hypothetical protein